MPRTRVFLALCSLALASAPLAPGPALTAGFAQSWAVTGWQWASEIGNSDADVPPEILFVNKLDGALRDLRRSHGRAREGVALGLPHHVELDVHGGDIDRDGAPTSSSGPIWTSFRGSSGPTTGTVPTMSRSSRTRIPSRPSTWSRSGTAGVPEDLGDSPTLRIPCPAIFGSAISPATFSSGPRRTSSAGRVRSARSRVDLNHDGISEMVLEDQTTIRKYNHSTSAASRWPDAGGLVGLGRPGQRRCGRPVRVLVTNNADGHYAIVDQLTGAIQQELPVFPFACADWSSQDIDGDGRLELVLRRYSPGQAPLITIYNWNGTSLVPLVTVAGHDPQSSLSLVQLGAVPSPKSRSEPVRMVLRDLTGAQLFRASTNIPGWSVTPHTLRFDIQDPRHVGNPDLIPVRRHARAGRPLADRSRRRGSRTAGNTCPTWETRMPTHSPSS